MTLKIGGRLVCSVTCVTEKIIVESIKQSIYIFNCRK